MQTRSGQLAAATLQSEHSVNTNAMPATMPLLTLLSRRALIEAAITISALVGAGQGQARMIASTAISIYIRTFAKLAGKPG